jgi:hypothetical protein
MPIPFKAFFWLLLNLGVQLVPLGYVYAKVTNELEKFWEYTNTSLVLMIAVSMLFAAIADMITEGHLPPWEAIVGLGGTALLLAALIQRSLFDEIISGRKPNRETMIFSLVSAGWVIVQSTTLKVGIWRAQHGRRG